MSYISDLFYSAVGDIVGDKDTVAQDKETIGEKLEKNIDNINVDNIIEKAIEFTKKYKEPSVFKTDEIKKDASATYEDSENLTDKPEEDKLKTYIKEDIEFGIEFVKKSQFFIKNCINRLKKIQKYRNFNVFRTVDKEEEKLNNLIEKLIEPNKAYINYMVRVCIFINLNEQRLILIELCKINDEILESYKKDKETNVSKTNETKKDASTTYEDLDDLVDKSKEEKTISKEQSTVDKEKGIFNGIDKLIEKSKVLDDKVDSFINWYKENIANNYTEVSNLRNFIEKFAVLYELKYPDYKLLSNKLNISNIINIENLSTNEIKYFQKPIYPKIVRYNNKDAHYSFYLDEAGYVKASNYRGHKEFYINPEEFENKHIKEIKTLLEEKFKLTKNDEIVKVIEEYDTKLYIINELLNAVMYRIIERGNIDVCAKRAFLFAKEYERDIDVPISYGIDINNLDMDLINEYLDMGGSIDLPCYTGYKNRTSKYEKLKKEPLSLLIDINKLHREGKENILCLGINI